MLKPPTIGLAYLQAAHKGTITGNHPEGKWARASWKTCLPPSLGVAPLSPPEAISSALHKAQHWIGLSEGVHSLQLLRTRTR